MSTIKYLHNLDIARNKLLNPILNPLTTAQRNTIGAGLTVADEGYVVFDITLNQLFFWDGAAWITINPTVSWGSITGLLSNQTDLQTALNAKFNNPTGTVLEYLRGDGSLATFPTIPPPQVNADWNAVGGVAEIFNKPVIPTVTPSSLTKTDDTNVTLTLTGSPNTALLQGVGLQLGWTGTLADSRIASATNWNSKEPGIAPGTTSDYWRGDKTWQPFPTIPTVGTWGALNYPTWTTGTPFVKMTGVGTFALDTNTYLTGITSLDVTTALGYTPYNSTNPAGYISGITSSDVTTALGYTPVTDARTITINGLAQDLTSNRTWNVGTVTSVGLSMPAAFNVGSSPITGAGTLAVTALGNASQYIRGDGVLANLPTTPVSGGASVNYYLNGSVSQGTIGGDPYFELSRTPILGLGTDFIRTNAQGNGIIARFITDANDPSLLAIPAGNFIFLNYFSASSSGGSPAFYISFYKYDGTTFTLIADNSANPETIDGGTTIDLYYTALAVPLTGLTITDRLVVEVHVITGGRDITLHTEGPHLSEMQTTFSTGITALNGSTDSVQFFQQGTSGTDFNISTSGSTHTFNLPVASAINTGKLDNDDWTTFNNKQAALNGTGIVKSTAGVISYLTDNTANWDTAYNNRIDTFSTTGNSGAATFISNVLNIPNYTLSGLGGQPQLNGTGFVKATGTTITYDNSTYTPTSTTITINGLAQDLSLNRTWNVGDLLSTGSYSNPTWLTSLAWTKITGTPTSLAGYGITDPVVLTSGSYADPSWITSLAYSKITGAPTNVSAFTNDAGYITSAALSPYLTSATAAATYVSLTGSYSNPSWITSLDWSKITGAPSFLTSAITSLNGLTGSTQTFVNDTNVTITSTGTTHTLGWTGTLADSRIASASTWNAKQNAITLTTTGTSGAATLVGNTLNIPQYSGGSSPSTDTWVLVGGFTNTTLTASTTFCYGQFYNAPAIESFNARDSRRIFVAKTGFIKSVVIMTSASGFSSVSPPNTMQIQILKQGGSTVTIDASYSMSSGAYFGNSRQNVYSGLNFSVTSGEWIEIRLVCPAWSTAPTGVNQIINIYFENV